MKFVCQLDYPDWLFVTRTGHEGEEFEKGKTTTVKQSGCGMCGAVMLADQLRATIAEIGAPYLVPGITNQVFPILSDKLLAELSKEFCFTEMERVSETHRAVRFCTSWATTQENMDKLCAALRALAKAE